VLYNAFVAATANIA